MKGLSMKRTLLCLVPLAVVCVAILSAVPQDRPSHEQAADRAEKILRQMTLEEKIDYIGGLNEFYIRAIPRLGVPELKMADGPIGVRNYGDSTAYPAGIAMAASWDTELVKQVGASIGSDARARGV